MRAVSQYTILFQYEYDNMSPYGSTYHSVNSYIGDVVQNANTTAYKQKFTDKMFLMDINQVHEVYENRSVLGSNYYIGSPTQKCVDRAEYKYSDLKYGNKWYYWLRSPTAAGGFDTVRPVPFDVYVLGYSAYYSTHGVRPAFFLNLQSLPPETGVNRHHILLRIQVRKLPIILLHLTKMVETVQ